MFRITDHQDLSDDSLESHPTHTALKNQIGNEIITIRSPLLMSDALDSTTDNVTQLLRESNAA